MKDMENRELLASIIGAFAATLIASFFSLKILEFNQMPIILASTGASAILIFGLPHNPASQPWNIIGGHLVSALIGVACYKYIPNLLLASSMAIPLAIIAMHFFNCMHPPGGATAITAITGGQAIYDLGFAFVIIPVFFNAIILLSIAIAVGTFRDKNPYEVRPMH